MSPSHRDSVESMLSDAAAERESLIALLPSGISASLPVDGQGATRAIEHIAIAAGLSESSGARWSSPMRSTPQSCTRACSAAPASRRNCDRCVRRGVRVRADALAALADIVGGDGLRQRVRTLFVELPPPLDAAAPDAVSALRAT